MAASDELRREVRVPVVVALSAFFGGSLFLAWYLGYRSGSDDGGERAPVATTAEGDGGGAPRPEPTETGTARDDEASALVDPAHRGRPSLQPNDRSDPSQLVVVHALELREDPTRTSRVLRLLRKGTTLVTLEQRGRWARVRSGDDGAEGWVLLPYSAATHRAFGRAALRGRVTLDGTPPEMRTPRARSDAEFCREQDVPHNAVLTQDGGLADVVVRIAEGQVDASYEAGFPASLTQQDCVFLPRVQVLLDEQELRIANADPTLHNVNAALGNLTLFNIAQPRGAPDLKKSFEEPGIYRIRCDVHAWMRAFVVVTDNPFFAVSDRAGRFEIPEVPSGTYDVVAWHSQFGRRSQEVTVGDDDVVDLTFAYDVRDAPPEDNRGELDGLF